MIIRGSGTRFFSTGYDMKRACTSTQRRILTSFIFPVMCDAAVGAARPTAEQDRAKLQQRREQFAKAFAENEEFQGGAVTAAGMFIEKQKLVCFDVIFDIFVSKDTGRSGVRAHTMAGLHLAHQVFYSNYFIMTMVNGLCSTFERDRVFFLLLSLLSFTLH